MLLSCRTFGCVLKVSKNSTAKNPLSKRLFRGICRVLSPHYSGPNPPRRERIADSEFNHYSTRSNVSHNVHDNIRCWPSSDCFPKGWARFFQLESALIYDAVQLFTTSVYNLSTEFEINQTPTPCNSSHSWKHGFTLINYMKMAVSTRVQYCH